MRKKVDWWLVTILILAAVLRLVLLGKVPGSLLWDEAALGYNGYSILQTGRDEYGKWLPVIFKSFGDFKPGLYVYLTVPAIAILGLTEMAVRLPAAVSGVVAVWLIYVLMGQLLGSVRAQRLVAFFLAISPWHIFFSRQAWEVGVMTTLLLAGVVAFWQSEKVKFGSKKYLLLSGVLWGLTFWTYQSAKVLTVAIVVLLAVVSWRKIREVGWRRLWWSGVPLVILGLPILVSAFSGAGGRIGVMSIFSYGRASDEAWRLAREMGATPGSFLYQWFYGDWIFFTRSILGRYLNHFSPRFLFFEGDWQNVRHGVPYMGQLYLVEAGFLMLGAWVVAGWRERKKWLVFGWLAVAPLLAALTRDNVQAVRAFPMVVPLAVLSGVGADLAWRWMKEKDLRRVLGWGVVGLLAFQIVYFWDSYLVHMKFYNAQESQYGYREVTQMIKEKGGSYERLVFTSQYGQPYIYWLFYNRYPPWEYQRQARLLESKVGDVGKVERIDNVEFREVYWVADRNLADAVVVGDGMSLPKEEVESGGGKILGDIYFPNGKLAFRVVRTGSKND